MGSARADLAFGQKPIFRKELAALGRHDLHAPQLRGSMAWLGLKAFDPFLHRADAAPVLRVALAQAKLLDDLLTRAASGIGEGKRLLRPFAFRRGGVKDGVVIG